MAAEQGSEAQLRGFAEAGDDDEVRNTFLMHAEKTGAQYQRLARKLEALGGRPSEEKSFFADLFGTIAKAPQAAGVQEEQTTQNLIAAATVESGKCALYEALATVAAIAGEPDIERLAREIQAEERQTAERLYRFLPSRSKIAFNVLTPHEIDPAIETKAPDDRAI